jgi:hypothetical protein
VRKERIMKASISASPVIGRSLSSWPRNGQETDLTNG